MLDFYFATPSALPGKRLTALLATHLQICTKPTMHRVKV